MRPTALRPASEVIMVTAEADSGDEGGDELALGLLGPRRSSWSSLSPLQAASPVTGDVQPDDCDEVILNLYKPVKNNEFKFNI